MGYEYAKFHHTVPRQAAKEKEILSASHISPKEHFKHSLRQVSDAAKFGQIKIILYSCILQLDLSEDYPEVLCEKKLLFAPPNLQERIAALPQLMQAARVMPRAHRCDHVERSCSSRLPLQIKTMRIVCNDSFAAEKTCRSAEAAFVSLSRYFPAEAV